MFTLIQLVLVMQAVPVRAETALSLLFVASQNSGPYMQFMENTTRQLQAQGDYEVDYAVRMPDEIAAPDALAEGGYDIIISVGTDAALALGRLQPESAVLYTLIPGLTFDHLKQTRRLVCLPDRCGVIYINQPLERRMAAVRAAFPDMRTLGVLLGPTSRQYEHELIKTAGQYGFIIRRVLVEDPGELQSALNRVLMQSDALFAVPDPVVYNSQTAQSILLTTYRHKVPMIAYSKSYLKAGATLSVYSTPVQFARQTAGIVGDFVRGGAKRLNVRQYPAYYTLRVNEYVAKTLGLDFVHTAELLKLMEEGGYE